MWPGLFKKVNVLNKQGCMSVNPGLENTKQPPKKTVPRYFEGLLPREIITDTILRNFNFLRCDNGIVIR